MFLALVARLCVCVYIHVCVESERDDVTFSPLLTQGPFSAGFICDIVRRTEQLDPLSFSVTQQPGETLGSALNVNVFPLFDFLIGFYLIIITWSRTGLERGVTKRGHLWQHWQAACIRAPLHWPSLWPMRNFPLEHDVNMLMCLPLLRHHPTDNKSCCVLPT